jgi:formiminoglutamase
MENLVPFTINDLAKVTNFRSGEVKFGEKMLTVPKNTEASAFLYSCDAKYVLFGIPEDIGVRANYGRTGAASAWESAIKSIFLEAYFLVWLLKTILDRLASRAASRALMTA